MQADFSITLSRMKNRIRYLIPLFLAALLPLSSLAEGVGVAAPQRAATKQLSLTRAKKAAAKVKKARKAAAKKAKKAKKARKAKKNGSIFNLFKKNRASKSRR
jgi:hypothetical protein